MGAAVLAAAECLRHPRSRTPDTVLFNGRSSRSTIASASRRPWPFAAIDLPPSERTTKSQSWPGPNTETHRSTGRAVTPGFIDNHAHYMEEGVLWSVELRLDGIETRKQAIEMIRAKAKSLAPGEWVYTLGGWSPDQFTDDKRPFTRAGSLAIVRTAGAAAVHARGNLPQWPRRRRLASTR